MKKLDTIDKVFHESSTKSKISMNQALTRQMIIYNLANKYSHSYHAQFECIVDFL